MDDGAFNSGVIDDWPKVVERIANVDDKRKVIFYGQFEHSLKKLNLRGARAFALMVVQADLPDRG